MANDSPDHPTGASGMASENVRFAGPLCASLSQARPNRPRPAVCCSATSSVGLCCPACSRRSKASLVESMLATRSTVKPGISGSSDSQISSSGQLASARGRTEGLDPIQRRGWPEPDAGWRLRLGASRVPRQLLAAHQQGYWALSRAV